MASTSSLMVKDVQDSLERLEQAQIEKQTAVDQRRNLHEQITALLKQVTLASEIASTKAEKLHDAAEYHDRTIRLQLCTKMRTKLPRELRDMIYDQIHGPTYYETIKKHINSDLAGSYAAGPEQLPFTLKNARIQPDFRYSQHQSRWWSDSHLSRDVATELVERWYQLRTFVIMSKHLYLLPSFLAHDIFNKDIEPGAVLYRLRCNVAIVQDQDGQFRQRHLHGLRHLGLIKNKRVDLVIRLFCPKAMWDDDKAKVIRVILGELRPLVMEWREAGFERVTVWNSSPKQDLTVLCEGSEEEYPEKLKLFGLYYEELN